MRNAVFRMHDLHCKDKRYPYKMARASYMQNLDSVPSSEEEIGSGGRLTGHCFGADTNENLAHRLPQLFREKQLTWSESDKIFASQWLSESNVLVGTKCNKLYLVDTLSTSRSPCAVEVPTLSNRQQPLERAPSSGIHSVAVSPDWSYLATSGAHPNDLAIYHLPDLTPMLLGQAHTDWIFGIQWLTEDLVITGSRDATMVLWSINHPDYSCQTVAEETPILDPVFHFSNHPALPTDCGERVRSLAYKKTNFELGSLQTNPCGASVHFWDAYVFQQVHRYPLPFCAENVCLEVDSSHTGLYAVGSRSHVTLVDSRCPSTKPAGSVRSPDKDCGIRSLNFNCGLLSLGTGAGNLYFYDIRTHSFLCEQDSDSKKCTLHSTPGWLRKDQTYRDFFSGLPRPPNAIYTHSYSPLRTKIFTAGGPLPLGLHGNYAAVWV